MSPLKQTRIAAYGLILDGRRILLCRIAEPQSPHHGRWTLPGGGIEFGESPVDAMIREVAEEIGLVVEPQGLAGVDSIIVDVGDITWHSLRILFHAKIVGGTLRNELCGSTDLCQWHAADDLPDVVDLVLAGVRMG